MIDVNDVDNTALVLEDGTTLQIPPHPTLFPMLLGDEQIEVFEDLLVEVEDYDRDEDGELLRPFRKDGARVKPSHQVRVVQAALGDEAYARLRAGGRKAGDVWAIWNAQLARAAA